MFKFRKPKLVDVVIRSEDLKIGDVLQLNLWTVGTVTEIRYETDQVHLKLENVHSKITPNETSETRASVHRDQKVIAWR